jgi:hypothetical protein
MSLPRRVLSALVLSAATACGSKAPTPAPTPNQPAETATTVAAGGARPDSVTASGSDAAALLRGTTAAPAARRRDRSVLSRTEIRETQYTNMYDVILALRANWVRVRSAESIQGRSSAVQVYLDMQRLPGLEELKTMSPLNILSVQYLDALQASARFGMDHGSGAILVATAKKS